MNETAPPALNIRVVAATGHGPTELAAFDNALVAAGVADRNLICLSSVLPPGSSIWQADRIDDCPGQWGDRLYCVMARMSTNVPGVDVHAGIGWVQDGTGRGLLVEHHSHFRGELVEQIELSLDALVKHRGVDLPLHGQVTASTSCRTHSGPACALVIAVFQADPWRPDRAGSVAGPNALGAPFG